MVLTRQVASVARGFMLIELIAVVVVLAVLSGIALPRYYEYASRVRTQALQGALRDIRADLDGFFVHALEAGQPAYPSFEQLSAAGTDPAYPLPVNPYNGSNTVVLVSAAQAASRATVPSDAGWCYFVDNDQQQPIAIIYANSDYLTRVGNAQHGYLRANEL